MTVALTRGSVAKLPQLSSPSAVMGGWIGRALSCAAVLRIESCLSSASQSESRGMIAQPGAPLAALALRNSPTVIGGWPGETGTGAERLALPEK